MNKNKEVKEYTVLKGVLPAKSALQEALSKKMFVFASSTGQVYSATTSISEIGIGKLGVPGVVPGGVPVGPSVKFGVRTTW